MRLTRSRALTAVGVAIATAAGTLLLAPAATAAEPTTPYLSEVHYDNLGTDVDEFVEVTLPPGTSVTGRTVVLYNGSNGAPYSTLSLSPVTPGAAETVAVAVAVAAPGIQNGAPDGLALVDAAGVVAEFLSYEGAFAATSGPAAGRTSVDIGVSEDGVPVGQSLSKQLDPATGTYAWRAPAVSSRGQVNPALEAPTSQCPLTPSHEIGAVQGAGTSTPLAGQQVTVRGTVVGDVPGLSGFYLQDTDGDGDPATSDAIFVFSPVPVGLGDTVALTGAASEFAGQTQITSRLDVEVCAAGGAATLPPATALDLPAEPAARERLEGMLVAPVDDLSVSEVFALTRFGELTLSSGGILVQPTELARPGTPEAAAIVAGNTVRKVLLDDGRSVSTSVTNRPYLSPTTPVRVGDVVDLTEPVVLGFGFGQWRLQPADGTADGVLAPQNTRPGRPDAVGGDVTVGAFNVLNYFLTWTGPDARGAGNAQEFARQSAKIVTAISGLDADVVTLMEIEDTDSTGLTPGDADTALADLVGRLNTAAGAEVWAYSPLPQALYAVDRDVIRNALVYRKDVVTAVGDPVGLVDETVWFNAREPQAQTFSKDGDAFTVVANHFKSKGNSRPPQSGNDNANSGDGQGAFNGDRTRQAASLASFVGALRDSVGDDDVLLMGDFNAYTREDPIEVLVGQGYADLGTRFDEGRYSYVFDALSGSLDHALGTAEVTAKVTDVAHWNINSVESVSYQYDGDPALYAPDQYRSSDHDPLLLGLDLVERCNGLVPTIVGTPGRDLLVGTNRPDVIMGVGGDDVVTGSSGDDVICGGAGDDVLEGGNGDDTILGGFGADWLIGSNGNDALVGGPGRDVLIGGRGADVETQEGAAS